MLLSHWSAQVWEMPWDVLRRNLRWAMRHRGYSVRSIGAVPWVRKRCEWRTVPSFVVRSERRCSAVCAPPSFSESNRARSSFIRSTTAWFPTSPLPSSTNGGGYRALHVFHRISNSASSTNPYLCPYHNISIESACATESVHGSMDMLWYGHKYRISNSAS